jgi:hypothetical protein
VALFSGARAVIEGSDSLFSKSPKPLANPAPGGSSSLGQFLYRSIRWQPAESPEQKDKLAEIVQRYGHAAKAASEKLGQEGPAGLG